MEDEEEEEKNSSLINDSDLVKAMAEANSIGRPVSIKSDAPKKLKEAEMAE